jgi:carbamoyl-phosphate synthase small subunit
MAARNPPPCLLVFEDGDVYRGTHFGWHGESCGEVVFNTALSGYEEVLTDPSYEGQIVVMTYPLIGNYGINAPDMESQGCYLEGFVIKELSPRVSNFRSTADLSSWLAQHKIVGLQGVDTRAIVFKVRPGRQPARDHQQRGPGRGLAARQGARLARPRTASTWSRA